VQAGRRLLGYAVARGYRDQPMLEILFNGPLFMEYCAFLIVGRRARRAHRGTSRLSSNMPASARQVEGITAADELGGLARLASLAVGHLPGEERARGTAWVARLARPPGALGGPLHAAGGRAPPWPTREAWPPPCAGACASRPGPGGTHPTRAAVARIAPGSSGSRRGGELRRVPCGLRTAVRGSHLSSSGPAHRPAAAAARCAGRGGAGAAGRRRPQQPPRAAEAAHSGQLTGGGGGALPAPQVHCGHLPGQHAADRGGGGAPGVFPPQELGGVEAGAGGPGCGGARRGLRRVGTAAAQHASAAAQAGTAAAKVLAIAARAQLAAAGAAGWRPLFTGAGGACLSKSGFDRLVSELLRERMQLGPAVTAKSLRWAAVDYFMGPAFSNDQRQGARPARDSLPGVQTPRDWASGSHLFAPRPRSAVAVPVFWPSRGCLRAGARSCCRGNGAQPGRLEGPLRQTRLAAPR
jgi:hypothetical protein